MLRVICCLLVIMVSGCSTHSGFDVIEHKTWSGANSYELTDGKKSIRYFKSSCPFPEETLTAVLEQIKVGAVVWMLMDDYRYRDQVLKEECAKQIILHAVKKDVSN